MIEHTLETFQTTCPRCLSVLTYEWPDTVERTFPDEYCRRWVPCPVCEDYAEHSKENKL